MPPRKKYPGISEPIPEPENLRNTIMEIKECVEILTRQRKPEVNSAVTWQDFIDAGIYTEAQVNAYLKRIRAS